MDAQVPRNGADKPEENLGKTRENFKCFRSGRGRRLGGLFLGADVLHLGVRRAHLVEHRLDDLAVGAGQDLAEHGTRNLNEQRVALMPVEPRRLKPGRKGVDADAGFNEVQELVPDICNFRFSTKLCSSCCHSNE